MLSHTVAVSLLPVSGRSCCSLSFLSPQPPPPDIYTLSLHDALPILQEFWAPYPAEKKQRLRDTARLLVTWRSRADRIDRKSTRLISSHRCISYAVFCLKKKKKKKRKCSTERS